MFPVVARRPFVALLLSLVIVATAAAVSPTPARAATSADMFTTLLGWINKDRADRGLTAFRADARLSSLATERAATMASTGVLSHTIAGSIPNALNARSIQWFAYGEVIGQGNWAWGTEVAANIYRLWKASPAHWKVLMSATYNYVGGGFVLRTANNTTYASVVVTESLDHTRPGAKMTSSYRSGTTVTWRWSGWDPRLQTHTAGLRDFDVQYRVGSGTWRLVRDNTTATSIRLYSRAHGRYHSIRVRARDRRGNLSAWSTEMRVWVP